MISILENNTKAKFFDSIKTLFPIKQIHLLKDCLNENTLIGKKFREPEEAATETNFSLTELENHLFNLKEPMLLWILVGYELLRDRKLIADVLIHITSYFLKVNFSNINEFKPAIPMTFFKPKQFKQEVTPEEPQPNGRVLTG